MATIKSYADIEQSNKLAEFLPLESADMSYLSEESLFPKVNYNGMVFFNSEEEKPSTIIPCWSLAALLNILPKKYYPIKDHKTDLILGKPKDKWCVLYWDATGMQDGEQILEDNPVDACYEMIIRLHELNLL